MIRLATLLPSLGAGLTVTQAAQQLGVSRVALSRVLNGRAASSPEMAVRIEACLGAAREGEARLWLADQSAYDVWQTQQRFKARRSRFSSGHRSSERQPRAAKYADPVLRAGPVPTGVLTDPSATFVDDEGVFVHRYDTGARASGHDHKPPIPLCP